MTEQDQDRATRRIIDETRAFVTAKPAPDLTRSVMRRVTALGVPRAEPNVLRRLVDRLWMPREVQLQWRPAYALAGAAAILMLAIFIPYGWQTPAAEPPSLATATADPRLFVQFRLDAPDAMDVRLAGSFTNWQPQYELHETSSGIWTITLPLAAGVHDYAFV